MPLTLYPAIDIKDGACVRLRQGDMARATIYGADPAAQAAAFEAAGCRWLHVVDLDGAVSGTGVNEAAVRAILGRVRIPVQLGGGIRHRAQIDRWLGLGVRRIVLGSAAVRAPALAIEAARDHPERIVVALDTRDGAVATQGWTETSGIAATELARRFEDAGIAAILHTDIARDGMLAGVALEETLRLASIVRIPVIASGGVGSLADLASLRDATTRQDAPRLDGVVVGRAFYEGRIAIEDAVRVLEETR